jgi:hypothetical protein
MCDALRRRWKLAVEDASAVAMLEDYQSTMLVPGVDSTDDGSESCCGQMIARSSLTLRIR